MSACNPPVGSLRQATLAIFFTILWLIPIPLIKKKMSGNEPRARGLPNSSQIPNEKLGQRTSVAINFAKGVESVSAESK